MDRPGVGVRLVAGGDAVEEGLIHICSERVECSLQLFDFFF